MLVFMGVKFFLLPKGSQVNPWDCLAKVRLVEPIDGWVSSMSSDGPLEGWKNPRKNLPVFFLWEKCTKTQTEGFGKVNKGMKNEERWRYEGICTYIYIIYMIYAEYTVHSMDRLSIVLNHFEGDCRIWVSSKEEKKNQRLEPEKRPQTAASGMYTVATLEMSQKWLNKCSYKLFNHCCSL